MQINCEDCMNFVYDEEFEEYMCIIDMDQDEIGEIMQNPARKCPFFRFGDDYTIVKKQN